MCSPCTAYFWSVLYGRGVNTTLRILFRMFSHCECAVFFILFCVNWSGNVCPLASSPFHYSLHATVHSHRCFMVAFSSVFIGAKFILTCLGASVFLSCFFNWVWYRLTVDFTISPVAMGSPPSGAFIFPCITCRVSNTLSDVKGYLPCW